MKNLVDIINESFGKHEIKLVDDAEFADVVKKAEAIIKKVFPKFWYEVEIKDTLFGQTADGEKIKKCEIVLAPSKEQSKYGIIIPNGFGMWFSQDDLILEPIGFGGRYNGNRIDLNPPQGSYLAMTGLKIPFRKNKSDVKSLLKNFENYLTRIKVLLIENYDNLYQSDERHPQMELGKKLGIK